MVCLEFEPGTTLWKVQTNPLRPPRWNLCPPLVSWRYPVLQTNLTKTAYLKDITRTWKTMTPTTFFFWRFKYFWVVLRRMWTMEESFDRFDNNNNNNFVQTTKTTFQFHFQQLKKKKWDGMRNFGRNFTFVRMGDESCIGPNGKVVVCLWQTPKNNAAFERQHSKQVWLLSQSRCSRAPVIGTNFWGEM